MEGPQLWRPATFPKGAEHPNTFVRDPADAARASSLSTLTGFVVNGIFVFVLRLCRLLRLFIILLYKEMYLAAIYAW